MGSKDGTVMGMLSSHQYALGSILLPGFMNGLSLFWVLVLAPRVFLWVLEFSSLHKNHNTSKFRLDLETADKELVCGCATANSYLL